MHSLLALREHILHARPSLLKQWIGIGSIIFAIGLGCTSKTPMRDDQDVFQALGIAVPKLAGWRRDTNIAPLKANAGGIFARYVFGAAQENGRPVVPIPGGPRIDLWVTPPDEKMTSLGRFAQKSISGLETLQAKGKIKILSQHTEKVQLGLRDEIFALRVQHSYAPLGSTAPISQISLFFIHQGRGLTAVAAGRTELFHPLSQDLNHFLNNIESVQSAPEAKTKTEAKRQPPTIQLQAIPTRPNKKAPQPKPIDLGKMR